MKHKVKPLLIKWLFLYHFNTIFFRGESKCNMEAVPGPPGGVFGALISRESPKVNCLSKRFYSILSGI